MRPSTEALSLKDLNPSPPCLTLILSTHKKFPDKLQDPIRFKQLLKSAEDELATYADVAKESFMRPLRALIGDVNFWAHTEAGVMFLRSSETFHVQSLNQPQEDSVYVGSHFRQPSPSSQGLPYFILSLHASGAQIYLADDLHIRPMETPAQISEGHARLLSVFPKHGGNKELAHSQLEAFFRLVDETVYETFSKPASFPVLIVCLSEHQNLFRRISHNPHLLPEGLTQHPASLPMLTLHEKSRSVMEIEAVQRLSKLIENFYFSQAQGTTSTDLRKIKLDAINGRIATLYLSQDAQEMSLKYLAAKVREKGGEAIEVPAGMLPTTTPVAAIYRY